MGNIQGEMDILEINSRINKMAPFQLSQAARRAELVHVAMSDVVRWFAQSAAINMLDRAAAAKEGGKRYLWMENMNKANRELSSLLQRNGLPLYIDNQPAFHHVTKTFKAAIFEKASI